MSGSTKSSRSAFRFSLRSLLLLIVPISLGLAALRDATDAWAAATSTLTFLAILGAVVAVAFDEQARRPIWSGFSILCGGYLFLTCLSPARLVQTLATTKANHFLLEQLHPEIGPETYPVPATVPVVGVEDRVHRSPLSAPSDSSIAVVIPPSAVAAVRSTLFGFLMMQAEAPYGPRRSDATDSRGPAKTQAADASATGNPLVDVSSTTDQESTVDPNIEENFLQIAQCLWALVLGFVGAYTANILATRSAGPAGVA